MKRTLANDFAQNCCKSSGLTLTRVLICSYKSKGIEIKTEIQPKSLCLRQSNDVEFQSFGMKNDAI